MLEDRTHRPAVDSPAALLRRARGWLGLSDEPPPPRPPRVRIDPVRRTWLGAFWQARVSVGARVPLDDYLRSRLAHYLAELPVPRARLTLDVAVDDGELRIAPREVEARPASPRVQREPSPDAWLAPLVEAEGPPAREELKLLEAQVASLTAEAEAARARTEALERQLAEDVASGGVAGPPIEATAEQMGRPEARGALGEGGLLFLAGVGLAAESWQVTVPLLRVAGVDPHRLRAEVAAQPLEVAFAALFALGVASGLFALTHAVLGAASAVAGLPPGSAPDARRRGWLTAAAATASVMGLVVAAAVTALPGDGPRAPSWAAIALLLALPVGSSLLLRTAAEQRAQRRAERAAALAWDRERAGALAERARRLEALEWAEEEQRELEAQRDATRRRLRERTARAIAVARRWAEAERRERADLARLGQSLVGALELDRYEFVRQASHRGDLELIASPHRPPPPDTRGEGGVGRAAAAGRLAG